jgi:TolB protein
MYKFLICLLAPLLLMCEDLEVRLATRSPLKPIYVNAFDEEWRSILEFDLNAGGFCSVLDPRDELEQSLLKELFDIAPWKRGKISSCLAGKIVGGRLEMTAYNIEQGSSKKYPPIPLERRAIHQLADAIHKDLFGKEGIASKRLIFTKRTKNGTEKGHDWLSEIWVADSDGANAKQITHEKSYCLSPSFLPGGRGEFFYVSEKSGQSKIYKASLSNPKGELMIDLRGNQALFSLNRKANQIAFITDAAGRPDLFIQNLDEMGRMKGKARQFYSAPRATQATPTYSPDGKQLAFVSDKDGPPRVYLLNVVNSKESLKPVLLTKRNRENTSPAWSPDGTKLAYSAKVDGVRQIWIYDFITQEELPLTTGGLNKENPSWAPDSFHLVYNTESDGACELYLIHLNQGEPIHIQTGSGEKRFASWEF